MRFDTKRWIEARACEQFGRSSAHDPAAVAKVVYRAFAKSIFPRITPLVQKEWRATMDTPTSQTFFLDFHK